MTGILAIDISNTNVSIALWCGDRVAHRWQLSAEPSRPADEYRVLVARLLEDHQVAPSAVAACVVGSVVPSLTPTISTACQSLFGVAPLVVGPGVQTGLAIRTDDPREVGADRIANAVAARARWGKPVIVLDFGTALTIDVVGTQGDYVGAVIAPGLEVAADALARRTAQLRRTSLEAPPRAIATDTERALQSGLVLGYVGMVEGLVRRVHDEVGPAKVVATGDAPWVATLLAVTTVIDAYEPLLTLDGLRRIHARQAVRD